MTRLLICLLAAAVLWPPSAHAGAWSYDPATRTGSYAGQRDAMTNANVRELVGFANDWLVAHGMVAPCALGPTGHVRMAPDLDGLVDGRALGCDVWILVEAVSFANGGDRLWLDELGFTIGHELMHTARDDAHPNGWSHADMGEVPGYDEDGKPALHVGPGVEADYQLACRWYVRAMVADARAARRARALAARRARTRRAK